MPVGNLQIAGTSKQLLDFEIVKSGDRAVDTAKVIVPADMTGNKNDEVVISLLNISDGLVGLWDFENDARDISGNDNDGTVTGATFVDGKVGKALKFNGSSDYVTMANETNFDFERTDKFSFTAWVKTTTTGNMVIVAKLDVGAVFRGYQFSINLDIDDTLGIQLINDNSTTTRIKVRTTTTNVRDGNDHHVVFTYDGSGLASGVKFYLDKVLQTNVVVTDALGANTILNNVAFRVATREDLGGKWNGDIDEVRVYNRELTQTEVNSLFDQTKNNRMYGGRIHEFEQKTVSKILKCKSFGKVLGETTIENEPYPKIENFTGDGVTTDFVTAAKPYDTKVEVDEVEQTEGTDYTVTVSTNTISFTTAPANGAKIKVTLNRAPENIVKDLVTRFTDLTYTSTETSGVRREKFVADGKLLEIIVALARFLQWVFRTDPIKQFFFESPSLNDLGITFTHGTNSIFSRDRFSDYKLRNEVFAVGAIRSYSRQEKFSGDGSRKVFTMGNNPVGTRITVDGAEQEAEVDYTVDIERSEVLFATAPPTGTDNVIVDYIFELPILVKARDEQSITDHGIHSIKVIAPWLRETEDAIRYAQGFVKVHKDMKRIVPVTKLGFDLRLAENAVVTLVNSIKGINGTFEIKEIKYKYREATTTFEAGEYDIHEQEFQNALIEKIHDLEDIITTVNQLRFWLSFTEQTEIKEKSPALVITTVVPTSKYDDGATTTYDAGDKYN